MSLINICKTKYVKAFTIQELLVGMVVSSLIMGMIYAIYVQLNKQLVTYDVTRQELMVFNQFKQLLSYDVALAKSIEQTGSNALIFNFSEKSYTYQFLNDAVIRTRENNLKDTFSIAIIDMRFNKKSKTFQALELRTKLMNENILLYEAKEAELATQINAMYN